MVDKYFPERLSILELAYRIANEEVLDIVPDEETGAWLIMEAFLPCISGYELEVGWKDGYIRAHKAIDSAERLIVRDYEGNIIEYRAPSRIAKSDETLKIFVDRDDFVSFLEKEEGAALSWAYARSSFKWKCAEKADSKPTGSPSPYIFRKERGDTWLLLYEGKEMRLTHLKGFHYIQKLLQNPGKEISATDLARYADAEEEKNLPDSEVVASRKKVKTNENGRTEDGLYVSQGGGSPKQEILDKKAIKQLKDELGKIKAAIGKLPKDAPELGLFEENKNKIKKELISAIGPGDIRSTFVDAQEKRRKSVSKAITKALDIIKIDHLDLYQHLANCLSTGNTCTYTPGTSLPWKF